MFKVTKEQPGIPVQAGRAHGMYRPAINTTVESTAVVLIGKENMGTITHRLGLRTEDHQGNNEKSEEELELKHG
ncbi:hypothetical protein [Absidia glauca]|uniref:Uncharacterized protein n=1 Tax=Absidia glauca TaxID=4829 RepID=A0A168QE00_ABSGL|nr:hypothetical protein [Absidia glauca]